MVKEMNDMKDTGVLGAVGATDTIRRVILKTDVNQSDESRSAKEIILESKNLQVHYGEYLAVRDVNLQIHRNEITALIGPSGCGKSTIIRCFNRMNDLIPSAKVGGTVLYRGIDLYGPESNAGEVRRRIGMVFQKPNPFPKTIFDNVAFGPRVNGKPTKSETEEIVERSLRRAALWEEVKDRLKQPAFSLSGGQQQRLCIARALAVDPDVLLMDEPCSALDPIATARIEDLMQEIKGQYPIVIVTHNMQQAARVSDRTAFFNTEVDADAVRPTGVMVEYDSTRKIFSTPSDPRTEQYISGRMG